MTRAWDMAGIMSNSSFGRIPSGTTANRPASPAVGDQYYNGTLGYLEIYTSSGWKPAGGIPSGNTSGRPSSPSTGQPYFNGELQRLELYTGSQFGWQNIVAETPGVTGYSGTIVETNTTNTITVNGTNFTDGATVTLIGSNGTEYVATSVTLNSILSLSATFDAVSASLEPYDLRVTNPSNLYGVYYDIVTVNDKPVWTTSAGSLGTSTAGQAFSLQLAAADEENNSLTYALVSGSLPNGLSLSSSGLISGTPTGSTAQTFNFTISVSDSSNTAQSRVFSLDYVVSSVSGGTLSSDSTYYYRTFTGNGTLSITGASLACNYLVVAGGGAGGGVTSSGGYHAGGGGGGAGGYRSGNNTAAIGNYSIIVGGGGSSGASGNVSSMFGIESAGGGSGFYGGSGTAAQNGGSGGGAGRDTPTIGYGNVPSTTPSQGNNGGAYAGNNAGAGGGGAGAVGQDSSSNTPGNGGSGKNTESSWLSAITPQMTGISGWSSATSTGYIAGGGGGGAGNGNTGTSSGGAGGGAGQSSSGGSNGSAGVTNTGGGGSGASAHNNPNGYSSGLGGSGIVIVRYPKIAVGG